MVTFFNSFLIKIRSVRNLHDLGLEKGLYDVVPIVVKMVGLLRDFKVCIIRNRGLDLMM